MEVAQPIWLSGCPTKGQFIAKNTKNAFLVALKKTFFIKPNVNPLFDPCKTISTRVYLII